MRKFAIQNQRGRFAHFRDSAQESKDAAVNSKPFAHAATWDQLRRDGYKCVKVEIKVLEDCTED